jgi:hypothetical protein
MNGARTRNRRTRLTRRAALGGLASASGAAVLLRPLVAEAEGVVPQRFLYMHYPCGTVSGLPGEGENANWYWFPRGAAGPGYTPSPLLNLFGGVKDRILPMDGVDLGDIGQVTKGDKAAQGLMYMGTGWLPVAVDGFPIDSQFDPPNAKKITVPKGTKTIDQYLIDKVLALTQPLVGGSAGPQYKSIQLAGTAKSMNGQGEACLKVLSYAGNNQPLWPEGRSQVAFNNIFGMPMGMDPAAIARRQAQKKSMLDLVLRDVGRLRTMVPTSQYPKLDQHLSALRELELRLAPMVSPDGGPGSIIRPVLVPEPTAGHNNANADEARHAALIENMLEIIRCAFVSDLTRVVSFTCADVNNALRPIAFCPNPGFVIESTAFSVSRSGGDDAFEAKGEMAAFYARLVAQSLARMSQTPEGSGNLLDNVLGMYFTECRNGDDCARARNPLMLFGGKFLKLNAGQFQVVAPSVSTNDVWASVLTAWGVPTSIFGDPQYAKGVIPGLFSP